MTILEQIDGDLRNALKEKNEISVSALRNLKSGLKNAEIEKRSPLGDAETVAVVAKKVKQHKDSIESFKSGNRDDLVAVEQGQMQVLLKYLPKQMDEAEITKIVMDVIASSNATAADFGKVMKQVMVKVKGQADGTTISKLVKENLK